MANTIKLTVLITKMDDDERTDEEILDELTDILTEAEIPAYIELLDETE